MLRFAFAWCLPILLLLLVNPRVAAADEVHVCVRPPGVPANLERWVFAPGGNQVWLDRRFRFEAKAQGRRVFVFNPWASPGSVALLPIPHNKLQCPRPPPRPPPPPPPAKSAPPTPKEDSPKPTPEPAKNNAGDVVPPGIKKSPAPPPERPRPSPPPPEGVLSNAPLLPPEGVLQQESVLPRRDEVSPPKFVDEEQTLVDRGGALPELQHRPGRPLVSVVPCEQTKEGCKGEGEGKPKTKFESFAQNLMLAGGLLNGDLGEDIHRADGKEFGMLGGDNPEGINNPIVQAAAGAVVAATALVGLPGKKFAARLKRAIRKKEGPIVIESAEELSRETAEKLAAYYKEYIADALEKNGTIGPYEVMREFTETLGGDWQAHHILEKAMARDLRITKELDKIPAVILTKAKHKRITDALAAEAKQFPKMSKERLWKVYRKVYEEHPEWLKAIGEYFGK